MENKRDWRPNISDICQKFYNLSDKSPLNIDGTKVSTPNEVSSFVTINILSVDDAIREHKSKDGNKHIVWDSFKYHSVTNVEAMYWVGYYYYHHGEDIPELQNISKEERIKIAIDIFKKAADKGNSSARLKYGRYLLQNDENVI